jgi:hypothetical protein
MAEDAFSWTDNNQVIVDPVDAIAVYSNAKGNVVVRQQGSAGGADQVITIPRDAVATIIEALQNQVSAGTTQVRAMAQGDGGGAPINP